MKGLRKFLPISGIKVKRLTPTAKIPLRAKRGDLGWDVYCDLSKGSMKVCPLTLPQAISTGLAFEFPRHLGVLVKARSSFGAKGVTELCGVVDQGYRGELKIVLQNTTTDQSDFEIHDGDKIAQIILQPVPSETWRDKILNWLSSLYHLDRLVEVDEIGASERGKEGFGSTGRK